MPLRVRYGRATRVTVTLSAAVLASVSTRSDARSRRVPRRGRKAHPVGDVLLRLRERSHPLPLRDRLRQDAELLCDRAARDSIREVHDEEVFSRRGARSDWIETGSRRELDVLRKSLTLVELIGLAPTTS